MTEDFEIFAGHLKPSDQMIEPASKDDIATAHAGNEGFAAIDKALGKP